MAGILDPKSKIMDVFLTEEGRYRLLKGLKIKHVSFTDNIVYYDNISKDDDDIDVSKILFESTSNQSDTLFPISLNENSDVENTYNTVYDKLFDKIGYSTYENGQLTGFETKIVFNSASVPPGKTFQQFADNFFSNIYKEYSKTNSLYTVREGLDDEEMLLTTGSVSINVGESVYLRNSSKTFEELLTPDYMLDARINSLSTDIKNKYLPPRYFNGTSLDETLPITSVSLQNIISDLFFYDNAEKSVRLLTSTEKNNLIFQMYEIDNNEETIEKLKMIEMPESKITVKESNISVTYKIILCGKIVYGKFLNIFSLVLYNLNNIT